MCGIVGFTNSNNIFSEDHIDKMLFEINHRGPDNTSSYYAGNVGLGHVRLSIIDLSEISNQPMVYKQYTIVFNGEIYNYLELKEELQRLGHTFHTNGDTEVILHAFEEWGEECQSRFRGMWAFVIYDSQKKEFFGSRDRFGIKPLYYKIIKGEIAFSSEIKPLLILESKKPKPNMEVISSYIVTSLINYNNETFFLDIYQLEGGTFFIYNLLNKELNIKRYYDLQKQLNNKRKSTFTDIKKILDKSLELHIRSDVPIGTCLSGGIDSSTVTSVVSEMTKDNKIYSVTAKSESKRSDESHFAKIVADYTGVEWEVVEPNYEYFKNNIEECLYYQEEPVGSPSILMQYAVMQKAKELNIKVMMDGQGGDESFLGYERFYTFLLSGLLKRGNIFSFLKTYIQIVKNSKLTTLQLFKQYIYFNKIDIRVKHLSSRHKTMKKKYKEYAFENLINLGYGKLDLEEMQVLELTKTNLPALLKYEDRNSMLASIEARVPFVDHEVIECAVKLSAEEKVSNGYTKYSLRKYSEKYLPVEISWRRDKKGFDAPNEIWLAQHKNIMKDYIENSPLIKELYTDVPKIDELMELDSWKLYNLSVWEKQFLL